MYLQPAAKSGALLRVGQRILRIKIGTYPGSTLADAREKAREVLRRIQLGNFSTNREERAKLTLGETIPQFIELYAKPRNRSWKSTSRVLTKFTSLNLMPIDAIKRGDVVRVLDKLIASGATIGANRALAAIKKLFAWCVDRGVIDHSPLIGLKAPAKEIARDRVLSDDELAKFRRTRCGARGATLMHPSWGDEIVGLSPFPAHRLAR